MDRYRQSHMLLEIYQDQSETLRNIEPYKDRYLNLENNPYNNPKESKTYVDESALDRYIDRIITNQAIALAEGKEHYEDFKSNPMGYDSSKIPDKYKIQSNVIYDSRLPKRRATKISRRSKKSGRPSEEENSDVDLPEGSKVSYMMDGTKMITLSVEMLRRYMYVEVEARVCYINEYYTNQWNNLNKEKMANYAEIITMKGQNMLLQAQMSELKSSLINFSLKCDNLQEMVDTSKNAKLRKRKAKRHRKNETSMTSQSDTGSYAGLNGKTTTKNDAEKESDDIHIDDKNDKVKTATEN